jgi:hypothetical protein
MLSWRLLSSRPTAPTPVPRLWGGLDSPVVSTALMNSVFATTLWPMTQGEDSCGSMKLTVVLQNFIISHHHPKLRSVIETCKMTAAQAGNDVNYLPTATSYVSPLTATIHSHDCTKS